MTRRIELADFLRDRHFRAIPTERQAAMAASLLQTAGRNRFPCRVVKVGRAGLGGNVVRSGWSARCF